MDAIRVEALSASDLPGDRDDLVNLLRACVHAGASIGFLAPVAEAQAIEYWSALSSQVQAGSRTLLAARDHEGRIVGSGQLAFESRANGRHRAEIAKVMVLPSHRRRGIAAKLMEELERHARARSVTLLFLDTSEGRGGAQAFYEALGYTYAGGIPGWALDPDGTPAQNAIYFKRI